MPAEGSLDTNRTAITFCVVLATLMQALDTTIANVTLPYFAGQRFGEPGSDRLGMTSYIVAAAIMTPPTGYLAGRFGLKRLFLVSVAGFTVASMLCCKSQTLVQNRALSSPPRSVRRGVVPLSQTVLLNINAPERQGSAIAVWGVAVMAGPVLGPVLGGWLTEAYCWPYGSSVGISVVDSLLTTNTQANHAEIAQHVTALNRLFSDPTIARFWNPLTDAGRADAIVTQQAQITAYIERLQNVDNRGARGDPAAHRFQEGVWRGREPGHTVVME